MIVLVVDSWWKNENVWYGIVNKSMVNIIEYMDDDMMIIGRVFE